MRKWMKKWQGLIIWVVAIAFVVGMIWWSVAVIRNPEVENYTIEQAVAYLVKDGKPIERKDYWLMPWEIDDFYTNLINLYQVSSLDTLFDEPRLKALIADALLQQKVVLYYAEKNNVKPSSREVKKEIENTINAIKKDKNQLSLIEKRYGSLARYQEKYLKPQILFQLTMKKVKEKVASVGEEKMKEYYEKNKERLQEEYDKVDLVGVSFEDREEAQKFLEKAKKEGFENVASSLNLPTEPLSSVGRGYLPEDLEDQVFSATPGSIVGPYSLLNKWYVFKVTSSQVLSSYENFVSSDAYTTLKNQLEQEELQAWLQRFLNEERISYAFNDQALRYWWYYAAGRNYQNLNVEEAFRELESVLFKDGVFDAAVQDSLKSLYVLFLEDRINELTSETGRLSVYEDILKRGLEPDKDLVERFGKMSLEEVVAKKKALEEEKQRLEKQREELVTHLYQVYPNSVYVVEKMYSIKPNDPKVRYDYFFTLYNAIKPLLSGSQDSSSYFNYLVQIMLNLYTLASSTNVPTDIRVESYYLLYDMSLLLKDATSAELYVEEMKKLKPDFMDYEVAYNQIESLKKELQTLSATETNIATESSGK